MLALIVHYGDGKKAIGESPAFGANRLKLRRLGQALARFKRQSTDWRAAFGDERYGQSRLRPLARRRASKRRPLLVAMRARKP